MSVIDPSPAEIDRRAAEIRRGWSEAETRGRFGCPKWRGERFSNVRIYPLGEFSEFDSVVSSSEYDFWTPCGTTGDV